PARHCRPAISSGRHGNPVPRPSLPFEDLLLPPSFWTSWRLRPPHRSCHRIPGKYRPDSYSPYTKSPLSTVLHWRRIPGRNAVPGPGYSRAVAESYKRNNGVHSCPGIEVEAQGCGAGGLLTLKVNVSRGNSQTFAAFI